jgi:hypothetical protein
MKRSYFQISFVGWAPMNNSCYGVTLLSEGRLKSSHIGIAGSNPTHACAIERPCLSRFVGYLVMDPQQRKESAAQYGV